MTERVPGALAAALVLALAGAATVPAATASAEDERLLEVGLAFDLANRAERAWALSATGTRTEPDELRLSLAAFAGASHLLAERLGRGEAAGTLGEDLDRLSGRAQDALDRGRPSRQVVAAWAEVRRALVRWRESGHGAAAGTAPEPAPASPEPPAPASPEPQVDPEAPTVALSTQWKGTFTPDLQVDARLEGRGLVSGELVVRDRSGREVLRESASIAQAIERATASIPRDGLATVSWGYRIDDDRLASGENHLVLTVRDRQGREGRAEVRVTKSLF